MRNNLNTEMDGIFQQQIKRNPGEQAFHQAAKEVLETLAPVLQANPEYVKYKVIERICEPERQIIFRMPW